MLTIPTAYGAEFRQDVIDVARKGEAPLAQIAKDFGLSVTTLKRWIAIAERKDSGAGPAAAESAEMRELKKRNRLLEQENEILRRAAAYLGEGHQPKMTLLWVLSSHDGLQLAEDGAADVAFEVPADLAV
jgi:transposase